MFNEEAESVSEGWHTYELRSTMIPNASFGLDNEENFCKLILYKEIQDSRVRIWDIIILVPNLLFFLFIIVRFNRARLKLRATSSPIFLAFYGLVIFNVVISVIRCIVSMTVNAAATVGGKADKVLWVTVQFFLLSTEMSVVIFGLAFGHLDSRSSIRRVLLATSFISLAFTITQGLLELVLPDDTFYIPSRNFYVFGHGGMMFWFCSSLVFTMIYLFILILPWTRLRERLALPTRKSFYVYAGALAMMDLIQSIGAGFLRYTQNPVGLCIVDFTAAVYLTLFTPLVYRTFLSEFLGISQPSIMFSYKAQVDDAMDEDTVSLPHQQSFSSLKTDSDYIYQVHTPSIHMPLYDSQAAKASTAMHRTSLYSLTSAKDSKHSTANPYSSQVALHRSAGIKNFARRFSAEKSIHDFAHYPLTKSGSLTDPQKRSLDMKFDDPTWRGDLPLRINLGTAKSVSNLLLSVNIGSNFIYNPRTSSSNSNLFFPTKKINSESALTFASSDEEPSSNLAVQCKNKEADQSPKAFSERSLDVSDAPLLGDRLQSILSRDIHEAKVPDRSNAQEDDESIKELNARRRPSEYLKDRSKVESREEKNLEGFESRSGNPLLDISDISSVTKNLLPESVTFSPENMPKTSSDRPKKKESAGLNQYLSSLMSPKVPKSIKDNVAGNTASKRQPKSLYTQTESL